MFSNYSPAEPEIWQSVEVRGAEIDPEERRVSVELFSSNYLSGKLLRSVISEIGRLYGIHRLELNTKYPSSAISQVDPRDLTDSMVMVCPSARLILAGSKWSLSEERIEIHLASNGKDQLEKALPKLRDSEVHSTVILSQVDTNTFRKLGMNLTCEPKYQTKKLFHT
jgi:hypothetical protein